jgi:hypothetical protein
MVCGGYAIVKENGNMAMTVWGDNKITDVAKDGFTTNEEFKFKIWDAVNEKELPTYGLFNDEEPTFAKDKRYYVNEFDKADTVDIALPAGEVVMVSSSVKPFQKYLGDILGESSVVIANESGNAFDAEDEDSDFIFWEEGNGYTMFSRMNTNISMYGEVINPDDITVNFPENDWTILPYPYSYSAKPSVAFAGTNSNIIAVKDDAGRYYIPSRGINEIGGLTPNKAYKVFTSKEGELNFASDVTEYYGSNEEAEFTRYMAMDYRTGSNMCVVIDCPDLDNGDEVIVKNSIGRVYGSAVSKKGTCVVTVWGNNPFTNEVEAAIDGEELFVEIYHKALAQEIDPEILNVATLIPGASKELRFTEDNILVLSAELTSVAGVYDSTNDLIEIFPTPANETITINVTKKAEIGEMELFDMSGKKVGVIQVPAMASQVRYNVSNLPDGVYILRTVAEGRSYENKIVIMKD